MFRANGDSMETFIPSKCLPIISCIKSFDAILNIYDIQSPYFDASFSQFKHWAGMTLCLFNIKFSQGVIRFFETDGICIVQIIAISPNDDFHIQLYTITHIVHEFVSLLKWGMQNTIMGTTSLQRNGQAQAYTGHGIHTTSVGLFLQQTNCSARDSLTLYTKCV